MRISDWSSDVCSSDLMNVPMIMSGSSLTKLEDVAALGHHTWFQAYLPGKLDQIDALIARIRTAGYDKLVITVDTPVAANRENNVRAGFSKPLRPSMHFLLDGAMNQRLTLGTFLSMLCRSGMPNFATTNATRGAPILSPHVLRTFLAR